MTNPLIDLQTMLETTAARVELQIAAPWLQALLAEVRLAPLQFLASVGLDVLVSVLVFLVLWFALSRYVRASLRGIGARELWDEERKEGERTRVGILSKYLRNVAALLSAALFVSLFVLEYHVPVLEPAALGARDWLVGGGVASILRIIVVGFAINALLVLVRKTARALTPTSGQRFERQIARAATIRSVIESSMQVALLTIFVLFVLSEFGANIGALLAGVGILGLAISFGAQSLVKDLISGFFILVENQFGVGDVVTLGGLTGGVESINLRITTLRDLEGRVHIIPNGAIDRVTVLSKEWSRSVIDVSVAYRTDLTRALDVLKDEAMVFYRDREWRWRLIDPPDVLGVETFGASGVVLRLMFKTLPKEQWGVGREFRKRIKARFDAEGIEIPFPHTTLYWGEGQKPDAGGRDAGQDAEQGAEHSHEGRRERELSGR